MSFDPLARLKALLRQRMRKYIEMERAKALQAQTVQETKNDEQKTA